LPLRSDITAADTSSNEKSVNTGAGIVQLRDEAAMKGGPVSAVIVDREDENPMKAGLPEPAGGASVPWRNSLLRSRWGDLSGVLQKTA
jgi:hypothetical protein